MRPMGTKTGDYCSQCPQKDGCKEVYERLGKSDTPSVVGKVSLAFLLPIAVFVGLLAVFENVLPEFEFEKWRTLAVFGLSIVPTLAAVWVIKKIVRTRYGNRSRQRDVSRRGASGRGQGNQ